MCDHFIAFRTYQHPQQPKAVWRCGACGRQSYRPMDCCTQPHYAPTHRPRLLSAFVAWAGEAAVRALSSVSALLKRRTRLAIAAREQPTHHPGTDRVAAAPLGSEPYIEESIDMAEIEETTHVAV